MRLLVSVVSPAEAAAALAGGAEIIDIKNPAEGPLGAASPATLRAVRDIVPGSVSVSAALGDAPHLPGTFALAAHGAALCGADYVKVGLLGSRSRNAALALLTAVRQAAEQANPDVRVVAVAYADAARVGGLPPAALPAVAAAARVGGVMLDTFLKHGGTLFDALEDDAIAAFITAARHAHLMTALAGSLRAEELHRAAVLGADIAGVRGSACDGGRGGTVSAARVRTLRATLSEPAFP
ncbi:MAG: (5-formylfuran-3-yl)methyl phosphate synthase, partial [Longimicrobiales bacterium]